MHKNTPLAVTLCAAPTLPEDLEIHLPDVPPEFIPQFDRAFRQTISQLSRAMDLSQVDGVTVGLDYQVALESIDRGIPDLPPLASTATAELTGIAMAADVVRDGVIRTHLVFEAEPILALLFEGDGFAPEDLIHARSVVAHECAHVQIAAEKRRAIPVCGIDRPVSCEEQAILLGIAEPWWDEYAVCRLSAPFALDQAKRSAAAVG